MQPELENIGDGAVKALQQWQTAYAAIQGVGVDIAAQTPTPGTTLEDTGIRTTGALSAVSRLRGVGKEQLELLGHRLATLTSAVEQVENQSQAITTTLGQFLGATSTDRNGQLNLQLNHPERGCSTNFDLGAILASINQHVSTLLDALPFIALVAGDESVPLFTGLARNASFRATCAGAGSRPRRQESSAARTQNGYRPRRSVEHGGSTRVVFLGSVDFLLVSALPIAAQLIPGPWQPLLAQSANGNAADAGPWLAALGKLIIMLPATRTTAFFAGNYAELFHLSREYAHMAALAKSIDGFQREAPQYKEEIVGGVFLEIQDNPGSRKAPRAATPQNPVTQKFLERLLAAIRAAKGS